MKSKHVFFTGTMGDLYLAQGYVDEAEKVYSSILKKDPRRKDCAEGLLRCERKRRIEEAVNSGDLPKLIRSWVELLRREAEPGRS